MNKQAVVHSSRLRYSHPSLELLPCFHRLHEPRSSCIHTSGCPCLPWHYQPHPVEARYGGCPNFLSRSSRTRLARYKYPSTSPSRHSQCFSSRWLGRVCLLPLSPIRYRKLNLSYHSFTDISISRKKEPNQQYTTEQIYLSSIPWSDFHF